MIANYLPAGTIKLRLEATEKAAVIEELVGLLCDAYELHSKRTILAAVLEREEMMSTGIGYGVAVPHAKIEGFSSARIVAGLTEEGIDFAAIDGKPVRIFFLLVSPKNGSSEHVGILSRLSRILNKTEAREDLLSAKNEAEFLRVLDKFEE